MQFEFLFIKRLIQFLEKISSTRIVLIILKQTVSNTIKFIQN